MHKYLQVIKENNLVPLPTPPLIHLIVQLHPSLQYLNKLFFSLRERTPAHRDLSDNVEPHIKQQRLDRMGEVFRRHALTLNNAQVRCVIFCRLLWAPAHRDLGDYVEACIKQQRLDSRMGLFTLFNISLITLGLKWHMHTERYCANYFVVLGLFRLLIFPKRLNLTDILSKSKYINISTNLI